jgi:AraC-like DNA-binding protein
MYSLTLECAPGEVDRLSTMPELEEKVLLQSLSDLITKLSYSRRLERAWRSIESNYSDSTLTLEKAARASGTDKNHLNVLLRQATNFTFHQLLVRYRLLKAVAMMKNKNYSLLEVALHNGFGSLNTFERNFRRLIGSTPREFKAEYGSMSRNNLSRKDV